MGMKTCFAINFLGQSRWQRRIDRKIIAFLNHATEFAVRYAIQWLRVVRGTLCKEVTSDLENSIIEFTCTELDFLHVKSLLKTTLKTTHHKGCYCYTEVGGKKFNLRFVSFNLH